MISQPTIANLPQVDVDPFNSDIIRNPYDFYSFLRKLGPVFWLSAHGTYGVAQYDHTKAVFDDPARFPSAGGASLADIRDEGSWRVQSPIIEVDPPLHTETRAVLTEILSPKIVRGWKEKFERDADALVEALLSRTCEFDAMSDLAEPFVFRVGPEALGVEVNEANLAIIGHHNFNTLGPKNELYEESLAEVSKVDAWYQVQQSREAMIPGGFGELIYIAEADGRLPEGSSPGLLRSFLRGGMDTTISVICSTLRYLSENSEQWQAVKSDPGLLKNAFEEAHRLEASARTLFRTTPEREIEFEGYRLAPNTKVQLFPGAANRDETKWENADSFDLKRKQAALPLGFGSGIHRCIGQMIARHEADALLNALVKRITSIEMTEIPEIRLNNCLRTYVSVPMKVGLA